MFKLLNAGRLAGLIMLAGIVALPFVIEPRPIVAFAPAPIVETGSKDKPSAKNVTKTKDTTTTSTKKTSKKTKKKKKDKSNPASLLGHN